MKVYETFISDVVLVVWFFTNVRVVVDRTVWTSCDPMFRLSTVAVL